jgi:hypothetical protein
VFCGHCGGRIFASTARKSHHTNPNKVSERIPIYKCYNRTQHKGICDGPTTYRAEKVDQVIEKILQSIFAHAREIDEREFIKQQVQGTTVQYQQKLKKAKSDYTKYTRELTKWEGLMLDSLEGTCVFSPEQIKKRMDSVQQSLADLSEEIEFNISEAQYLSGMEMG